MVEIPFYAIVNEIPGESGDGHGHSTDLQVGVCQGFVILGTSSLRFRMGVEGRIPLSRCGDAWNKYEVETISQCLSYAGPE